ncbi:MAG TPA: hypothetical protein VK211_06080, partial [Kamptonema sp.]|nr:hypothetical protein [Kamptonema sp.]
SALHIQSKVLPGNKIEIDVPEGSVGDRVDVFVILPPKTEPKQVSVMDILSELPGKRLFQTPEEADKYLQEERDSWER